MREAFYMNDKTVILNFSAGYYQTMEDLLNSDGFKVFMANYLKNLAVNHIRTYAWLTKGRELDEMCRELVMITKQLLVLNPEEIYQPLMEDVNRMRALFIVEDAYNFWRRKQRFSIVNSSSANSLAFGSFMDADTHYNQLVRSLYRVCEEKLQGRQNRVYRQLQAGTNASVVLQNYRWKVLSGYNQYKNIPFINTVMLRTPILLHPQTNKRTGTFEEVTYNPMRTAQINGQEFFCFPLKVSDLLCFVYFHRDFMASGLALANLFELASEEECLQRKPDLMCIFGNPDEQGRCLFHHDEDNDVWVGSVSYDYKIEYFGYIKKMILTLHNVCKMQQGALPVHGSMIDIHFRDNSCKSIVMIGDSGAGKSETIEVLKNLNNTEIGDLRIERMDVVFDDMGSLHIADGHVYAKGSETGAFVRLDDLDKGTAYRDMERSIFFNPETSNARVVSPISTYELISRDHPVSMVLYANNYDEKIGVHRFQDIAEAKKVFCEGKRFALGTTQEVGLSSTYFANPFGPMQQQDKCNVIMDRIFGQLYDDGVYVGEIYTNLGTAHKENLRESGKELLEILKQL